MNSFKIRDWIRDGAIILLMMRVVARDMAHLRQLVDKLTRFGATRTDVIFSTLKSQPRIDQSLKKAAQ